MKRTGDNMYLEIDFNSDEAFYVQLCNQIIIGTQIKVFRKD